MHEEDDAGLMQAVERFEPEKGFRLATYAMWWMKAALQEYVLRTWSVACADRQADGVVRGRMPV
jgi:DNA-directed RNA polymerase sigma subunit (sigma70/sigma32)